MNCQKCNFDFGALRPNYCPNCGKKVVLKEEAPVRFKKVDYLRFLDRERFTEFWGNISGLDADSAYQWLQNRMGKVSVFSIHATYKYTWIRSNGETKVDDRESDYVSVDRAKELLTATYYSMVFLRPKKIDLSNKMSPYKFGETWWWTKEDCELAIKETIRLAKEEIEA